MQDQLPQAPVPMNLPVGEGPVSPPGLPQGNPSPSQQSWGVVISIVVIVTMIITGAFYAWGKRIAEQQQAFSTATSTP